jgi:hypothetical protein
MTVKETFRNKTQNSYTIVENELIADPAVSCKAKAILIYLMSKPDGWRASEVDIANHMKDGSSSVRSGMKELRELGYIKSACVRDPETGRAIKWETHLLPYSRMRNPQNVENQPSGDPADIVNKEVTTTELVITDSTPSISPQPDPGSEERVCGTPEEPQADLETTNQFLEEISNPQDHEQQTLEQPAPLSTIPETTKTAGDRANVPPPILNNSVARFEAQWSSPYNWMRQDNRFLRWLGDNWISGQQRPPHACQAHIRNLIRDGDTITLNHYSDAFKSSSEAQNGVSKKEAYADFFKRSLAERRERIMNGEGAYVPA